MKIDKYLKTMSERLGMSSSYTSDHSTNNGDGSNNNKKDGSFYCVHCDKVHQAYFNCPEALFGDGDYFCDPCGRVHYPWKGEKCPYEAGT